MSALQLKTTAHTCAPTRHQIRGVDAAAKQPGGGRADLGLCRAHLRAPARAVLCPRPVRRVDGGWDRGAGAPQKSGAANHQQGVYRYGSCFLVGNVCGRSDRYLVGVRETGRQNGHRPFLLQTTIYPICTALPQQKRCACPPSPRACWEPTGSCGSSSHFQSLTPSKPRYAE